MTPPQIFKLPTPQSTTGLAQWDGLPRAAAALAITEVAARRSGLTVVVCADTHGANRLEADLNVFADSLKVQAFPDWETLPYDLFSPHPDIVSDRVRLLSELAQPGRGIIVVPAATLSQRLPPRSYVRGFGLSMVIGQPLDIGSERRRLEDAGYRCVPQVTEHGDFAVRGALLDLFPMGSSCPYRIELFDDEVESIRSFDPETQLSIEKVDQVQLLPGREFPFDDQAIEAFRAAFRNRFDVNLQRCSLYQDARQGVPGPGIEYYLPLFFEHTESLFEYLPRDALIIIEDGSDEAIERFREQLEQRHEARRHDLQRPILTPEELYLSPEESRSRLDGFSRIDWQPGDGRSEAYGVRPAPSLPVHGADGEPGEALKAHLSDAQDRVLIAVESAGRRELIADQLAPVAQRPTTVSDWKDFLASTDPLCITVAGLDDGFQLNNPAITVLTERQLFGDRARTRRLERRSGRDPETIIRDLTDLNAGSPVVHEDYGVGRYLGLQRLDAGGTEAEFLTLEYANGDKLYVPVASLHLVSRYTGTSPDTAPLHKLGSNQWEKARRRAAQKARDVAAELLDIYARREARTGQSIPVDRRLYEEFAASFPFEETADQATAIEAVIDDLTAAKAMDRVVCGDVGFGKTEVALRAAFAAAQGGKQVALLVPTTLLAQQHYQNFLDRFANWPVRIEVLSRFRSKKDTDAVLSDAESGKIDVLIGTHRLLQRDIHFKDLGLLIIDEEQRFGVRQKERLKKMRAEVDVLTLTATPIPRTLNQALSGLRDLSIIATAPAHRMAVKTFISQWDDATLKDAVQRELQRGGQIFFLHNEVKTIERMGRQLQELFPQARLRIAHGQMRERELEQVMLDFYHQRFNLLLCSTIIESGIDIPTANTIIINRADRFGLAQLHQLRGRVGRSHHRAYAYLIVPHSKAMTADARKRLEALESMEELGAGFTLATHDLEIRGAGELLGDEQSGQIQEVGFSLYMDLLERAVTALKSGEQPELDAPLDHGAQVELGIPALIPDSWLPDVHARLVLYKRIASAEDQQQLDRLQVEMIDRFGLLPEQVKNLFSVTTLKLRASPLGIREMDLGNEGGRIVFTENPTIEPMTLIRLIQSKPKVYSFDGQQKIRFRMELPEPEDRINAAIHLLGELSARDAA